MALLTKAVQWAARWGLSSAGRALHWQCRGQGFDSPRLHQPSSSRHAELASASICQLRPKSGDARWTLKEVQGDKLGY